MQRFYTAIGLASQILHRVIEYQVYRGPSCPLTSGMEIIAQMHLCKQTHAFYQFSNALIYRVACVQCLAQGHHIYMLLLLRLVFLAARLQCCQYTLHVDKHFSSG